MQQTFPFSLFRRLPQLLAGALLIALLLGGAFRCSVAHAASGQPIFSLQPVHYDPSQPVTQSYFVFDSHPGMILHNQVRVTNSGSATGTASLYTVDATTGQTSGLVYLSQTAAQHEVGTWITLEKQQVTLAPGQSQIVLFQVAIPSTTWSGQHVGGIVVESATRPSSPSSGAIHIIVQNLTIIAVQINLPGTPIEQLIATGIQPGGENAHQNMLVGLRNTGNTMLKPVGTLHVTDSHGHLIQNLAVKLDTLLPHTSINYPVYLKGTALGAGTYQAELTLTYGHKHVLYDTRAFTITHLQVKQVFNSSPPLQAPWFGGDFFNGFALWQLVLGGFLLLSGLIFWGQRLYHVALVSFHSSSRKR